MRIISFLLFAGVMFFSCNNKEQQKEVTHKQQPIRELTKLEQLYLLPKYFVYDFYDLSNLQLSEIPNLSEYTIKKLDLSYNNINDIDYEKLPYGIKSLNLSNNIFTGYISFKSPEVASLEELDLSYNKITDCSLLSLLKRLHLNNNDITGIAVTIGGNKLQYLNISNNPKMSNMVKFIPQGIDTIVRTNIKNNKKLIFFMHVPQTLCILQIKE